MDELRAIGNFTQAELWEMTPLQMSAWLFVAGRRRRNDRREHLAITRAAMHAKDQDLRNLMKADD